jgi:hypothetical protein
MSTLSGTSMLIPLPVFSPRTANGVFADSAGLRQFGVFEGDLAVDFSSADRAALVTRLLELCVADPGQTLPDGFFRDLSIGKRIECLLVLAAGGPDTALGFPFKCMNCGEEIELELTLSEISAIQQEADCVETVGVDVQGGRLEFRKPTGRDQESWAAQGLNDELKTMAEFIGTLAVRPNMLDTLKIISSDELGVIEAAIEESDPLVDFNCNVNCGECGEWNDFPVDLTETALRMLNQAQDRLVVTIHRLAAHYHWSEKEIFAVPDRRRRQYLELIGTGRK